MHAHTIVKPDEDIFRKAFHPTLVVRRGIKLHQFSKADNELIAVVVEEIKCCLCTLKEEYKNEDAMLVSAHVVLDLIPIVVMKNMQARLHRHGLSFTVALPKRAMGFKSIILGVGKFNSMLLFAYKEIKLKI